MTGKTAVVTGAGSGIGRSTALALLKEGWTVALVGRTERTLRATASASRMDASKAIIAPIDVTDEAAVNRLFVSLGDQTGSVDLLFNNAGIFDGVAPFEDITLKSWRSVIETNLTGSFLCAQAAFRQMKRQSPMGGRIVNNGSISAYAPRPHAAAYTASKNAVTGLTRSISLEGRRFNIACGQIDIGNATTAMTENMPIGMLQASGEIKPEATMGADNVVSAILYMAALPLEANVQFMTIIATGMPFVGRG